MNYLEERFHQFCDIMNMSVRIKISLVAKMMDIQEFLLVKNLLEWNKRYPFLIDGDYLINESLHQRINQTKKAKKSTLKKK